MSPSPCYIPAPSYTEATVKVTLLVSFKGIYKPNISILLKYLEKLYNYNNLLKKNSYNFYSNFLFGDSKHFSAAVGPTSWTHSVEYHRANLGSRQITYEHVFGVWGTKLPKKKPMVAQIKNTDSIQIVS